MVVADKLNLIMKQFEKNKLSHAFLLETNNNEMCLKDIKELLKKINCPSTYNDNCSVDNCNLCKLITLDNLPSIVIIEPDGANIKRNQMEELEEKFSYKPIYSKYNCYIIVGAEKMNASAANTILKFLEEPEDDILGFFITNNLSEILPTIKSRCEIINVNYQQKADNDEKIYNIAKEYLQQIINSNDYMINKELLLKLDSDRLLVNKIFIYIYEMYQQNLLKNINDKKYVKNSIPAMELMRKCLKQLQFNANLELVLDSFVIEMRRIND